MLISPPLVSRLRLTICSLGSGGPALAALGESFSPLTLLCLRRVTASLRRPCRALGKRDEDLLFASIRARLEAASRDCGRDGGRDEVRRAVGVLVDCKAANEVELRARRGGFVRFPGEGATVESSARSHMAAEDCDRVMRSRPVPGAVGVFDKGGSMRPFFNDVGVGGVRPIPLPTRVLPVLDPEPSRRPDEEAGRRRFMPTPEARETLRFPLVLLLIPDSSTSSQARTSSSAICRTNTALSWSISQLMRS